MTNRFRVAILVIGVSFAAMVNSAFAQTEGAAAQPAAVESGLPSLWDLAVQGGWFMIPIGLASIVTITFTLERLVGLKRNRILPPEFIAKLRELMLEPQKDPRKVWQACQDNPSPLANVVKAAILKTGRPHAEVEKAVEDAVDRETDGMTRNLRPINVVASIAPLLGLLGTVQGMILAFMVTSTTTSTGTAKAQELAHGIYTALVTTFAGLCVAVISVVLANFLEGRIEALLRKMEAIFLDLLPQLERFEGRLRVTESMAEDSSIRVKLKTPSSGLSNGGTAIGRSDADRPSSRKTASGNGAVKPRSSTKTRSVTAVADPKSDSDNHGLWDVMSEADAD